MRTRTVLAVVASGPGKFSAPGVPPICELTVQFAGDGLAALGLILASETPPPSGPTGQSPSVPYWTQSISR